MMVPLKGRLGALLRKHLLRLRWGQTTKTTPCLSLRSLMPQPEMLPT